MKPDEFQGIGGRYEIRDGKRVRVEESTRPSDTGGARDADGKPFDAPAAVEEKPAAAKKTSRTAAAE